MRRAAGCLIVTLIAAGLSASAAGAGSGTWLLPAANLSGTRAAPGSALAAANVRTLTVAWRFAPNDTERYGTFTSTPLIDDDTVYVEDLRSNVFALDRRTGKVRWVRRFDAINDGPNGLALVAGRIYGATDSEAFALSAVTGRVLW